MSEEIILRRNCRVVLIPEGDDIALPAGEPVRLHQTLGGNFTVWARDRLVRIQATDADALGKEAIAPRATAKGTDGVSEERIWEVLKTCFDPEIPVNIVDLGLVYDLAMTPLPDGQQRVEIKMTLTAPGCGMGQVIARDVEEKVRQLPGVAEVEVALVWDPMWNRDMMSEAAKLELGLM